MVRHALSAHLLVSRSPILLMDSRFGYHLSIPTSFVRLGRLVRPGGAGVRLHGARFWRIFLVNLSYPRVSGGWSKPRAA